jgi:tyrosinase
VRYPSLGDKGNEQVDIVLKNESAALRASVSILLLSYSSFDAFSHNRWSPSTQAGTYGSLENIHDNLHSMIGGNGGHMGGISVSAYDPVFWLHHW